MVDRLATDGAVPLFVFDAFSTILCRSNKGSKALACSFWFGCARGAASMPTRRVLRPQPVVRVVTERSSAVRIQRRGPNLPTSIAWRVSATARCAFAPGKGCIPRCACTKGAAAADRCPSSGVRLCWWKWGVCRVRRDAASRRSCGCGGMVLAQLRRISTSSGDPTFAGSIGAHFSLPQIDFGVDYPASAISRAGRPLELDGTRRLHPVAPDAPMRRGPKAAVGASLQPRLSDPGPGPSRRFGAFGGTGHAHQATKTLRSLPEAAQRTALRPCEALPGHQEGCLNPKRSRTWPSCDGLLPRRKTSPG
jgi:hypothetical protein